MGLSFIFWVLLLIFFFIHVHFNLRFILVCSFYTSIFFFYSSYFFITKEVSKKVLLLKKLNGSILNQFATCSACGTRLLRKLKHPRLLLQVPFYFKLSPVF